MAIVKLKPTSAGRRAQVKVVNPDLYKGRPVDALIDCNIAIIESPRSTEAMTACPVVAPSCRH